MEIDPILQRLNDVKRATTRNDRWYALCPCHADTNRSLCITKKEKIVLMHCFSCKSNGIDVCNKLGIDARELFKAE